MILVSQFQDENSPIHKKHFKYCFDFAALRTRYQPHLWLPTPWSKLWSWTFIMWKYWIRIKHVLCLHAKESL